MTTLPSYSFGNRWVGIVALREPPSAVPVPLHRMAERARQRAQSPSVWIDHDLRVTPSEAVLMIREAGHRYALKDQWQLARQCARLAADLFRGRRGVRLPRWLRQELVERIRTAHAPSSPATPAVRAPATSTRRQPRVGRRSARPAGPRAASSIAPDHSGETGPLSSWGGMLPGLDELVDDLPPARSLIEAVCDLVLGRPPADVPNGAADDHDGMDDEVALWHWLRLASIHTSYLYEHRELSTRVSPGALALLAAAGKAWLSVVTAERVTHESAPDSAGALSSGVAQHLPQVRRQLTQWLQSTGCMLLGRGEQQQHQAGRTSRAAEQVALQVAGVICLAMDRPAGLRRMMDEIWAQPSHRVEVVTDWGSKLQQYLGYAPGEDVDASGPDHDRTFGVRLRDHAGRSARGTGRSLKAARRDAAHAYLLAHAPQVLAETAPAPRKKPPVRDVREPHPYSDVPPGHHATVTGLRRQFGLPDNATGWLAQALPHSSWAYEHGRQVTVARQRAYDLLAGEGSHLLNALIAHRQAADLLRASLTPTTDQARVHSVPAELTSQLFDDLLVGRGLLTSRGLTNFSDVIKQDVIQAVIAVAWRFRGPAVLTSPPPALQDWMNSTRPDMDASSQLQRWCSAVDIDLEWQYDSRGPHHATEVAATVTLSTATHQAQWTGPWTIGSKVKAKKRTAGDILDLLVAHTSGTTPGLSPNEARTLALLMDADVRHALRLQASDPSSNGMHRNLSLHLLIDGDLTGYLSWAARTESLICGPFGPHDERREPTLAPDVLAELHAVYIQQLTAHLTGPSSWLVSQAASIVSWAEALVPETLPTVREAPQYASLAALAVALEAADARSASPREMISSWWQALGQESGCRIDDRSGRAGAQILRPGMASVGNQLMTMCAAAAFAGNADLEIHLSADDEAACIAIRIPGINLEATLADVCDAVDRIVPGAIHQAERDELILRLPWNPPDVDGGLATAGRRALADVLGSAQLEAIRVAAQQLESALNDGTTVSSPQPLVDSEARPDHAVTGETGEHHPDPAHALPAVRAAARALAQAIRLRTTSEPSPPERDLIAPSQ